MIVVDYKPLGFGIHELIRPSRGANLTDKSPVRGVGRKKRASIPILGNDVGFQKCTTLFCTCGTFTKVGRGSGGRLRYGPARPRGPITDLMRRTNRSLLLQGNATKPAQSASLNSTISKASTFRITRLPLASVAVAASIGSSESKYSSWVISSSRE